jgi:hypothetical protein
MALRPQTLYGIADSPVGLAAYFLDHDARSYQLISRIFAGDTAGLTRDDILDNITIAWLGDVYDTDSLASLIAGHDALISAFNPGWTPGTVKPV